MKRSAYLWVVIVLLMAAPALAQQEQGDTELQLQGSLSLGLDDEFDNAGSANAIYGLFFTERQEVGGALRVNFNSDGDLSGAAGPFYRYNFPTSGKAVPYVGAAVAATFGEYQGGDIQLDLEGGSRWFLARNMAFTLSGLYSYDVDASEFADRLAVLFGFSYLWDK
jgi:hypothetical protein